MSLVMPWAWRGLALILLVATVLLIIGGWRAHNVVAHDVHLLEREREHYVEVLVVARDVPRGSVLSAADVEIMGIPSDLIVDEIALPDTPVVGATTIGSLFEGEYLRVERLAL